MAAAKLSIFLLIRSLDVGGTQRQVAILAKGLQDRGHPVAVGVFYSGGAIEQELHEAGITIVDLRKKGRWDLLSFIRRLIRELRRRPPDVIYGFMGGGVVASAVRPFLHRTRVIWGVRASNMDLRNYDLLQRLGYKLECLASRLPDLIIANSSAGAAFAIRNGFPAQRVVVVANGIDTDRFRPDRGLRTAQRRLFGLDDGDVAIGVLARLDPMKGHRVFLEAASACSPKVANLRFLLIGEGSEMHSLKRMAQGLGIADRVIFAGEQEPVAALNALDVACSPSVWGEGFSNSVAEAMACGLPCIVSDVGDSRAIVGDTGRVVPASSPAALAQAIQETVRGLREHDPQKPRQRIVERFSVDAMVDQTITLFRKP